MQARRCGGSKALAMLKPMHLVLLSCSACDRFALGGKERREYCRGYTWAPPCICTLEPSFCSCMSSWEWYLLSSKSPEDDVERVRVALGIRSLPLPYYRQGVSEAYRKAYIAKAIQHQQPEAHSRYMVYRRA